MRHRIGLSFLWLFLFSVTLAHGQNQNPFDAFQHFSASVSGSPLKWDKMKIYRSEKQIRAEYVYENEVRISNLGDRKGWFIRPTEWKTKPKECGRMTLMDMSSYPFFAYSAIDFKVERAASVGKETPEKETIDGHSCKVQDYTVTAKDGGQPIKAKLWEAEDLDGFPIKMQIEPPSKAKFVLNYTDVSLNPPDPKLFQLPAICRVPGKGKKKAVESAPKAPSKTAPQPK
jgi:hypothetical protein